MWWETGLSEDRSAVTDHFHDSFLWFSSTEQGEEFSQPWNLARQNARKTTIKEEVKHTPSFIIWFKISLKMVLMFDYCTTWHKQMNQPSWKWKIWIRKPCVLLECWSRTPYLWPQWLLSRLMFPIKGLKQSHTHISSLTCTTGKLLNLASFVGYHCNYVWDWVCRKTA